MYIIQSPLLGLPLSDDEAKWTKDYEGFWKHIYGLDVVEFRDEVREMILEDAKNKGHALVIGMILQRLSTKTGHPELNQVNDTVYSISAGGRIPYFG